MIVVDKKLCDYCGTCVAVCDPDAIDLFHEDIRINSNRCIECLKCTRVCPVEAITQIKEKTGKSN
jgi:4Fe-4S ferredoxin